MAGYRSYLTGIIGIVVVSATVFGGSVSAADAEAVDSGRRTVDLIFDLPEGEDPRVVVTLDDAGLHLDLPGETGLPLDLVSEGDGLVARAEVKILSGGRSSVVIELAGACVEQVLFQGEVFVVRLGEKRDDVDPIVPGGGRQYRLGPDDKILIAVDGQPDLTQQLVVRRNGRVAAPLLGDIQAAGLTVQELGGRLTGLLEEDFLVDPHVNVEVVEYKSQWVVVSGEVRIPGRVALKGGTLLTEVIADAGGLGPEAGQKIVISKGGQAGHGEGVVRVQRREFESGAVNPVMEHGDMVNVARVAYCYVDGEVRRPGRVEIEPGMTLLRALSLVGGMTEWANRKDVRIIQEGAADGGTIHNLKRIQAQKAPDPALKGGEIIIVPRRFL